MKFSYNLPHFMVENNWLPPDKTIFCCRQTRWYRAFFRFRWNSGVTGVPILWSYQTICQIVVAHDKNSWRFCPMVAGTRSVRVLRPLWLPARRGVTWCPNSKNQKEKMTVEVALNNDKFTLWVMKSKWSIWWIMHGYSSPPTGTTQKRISLLLYVP